MPLIENDREGDVINVKTGGKIVANGTQAANVADASAAHDLGDKASLSDGSSNSQITFTAVDGGPKGNSITVTLVDPGSDGSLGIVVTGTDIVATLAYGSGAITTTVSELIAAIAGDEDASALVVASTSGDGSGLVAALSETALTGGITDVAEINAALDALGGKLNSVLAALEGVGVLASS